MKLRSHRLGSFAQFKNLYLIYILGGVWDMLFCLEVCLYRDGCIYTFRTACKVCLGEQVDWVLVFIQLRQWEMYEGGATVRRDEEEEECSALDWIGSTYELVIYVHSINSKEGPWLSTYLEKMFQNSRLHMYVAISLQRGISLCISRRGAIRA